MMIMLGRRAAAAPSDFTHWRQSKSRNADKPRIVVTQFPNWTNT